MCVSMGSCEQVCPFSVEPCQDLSGMSPNSVTRKQTQRGSEGHCLSTTASSQIPMCPGGRGENLQQSIRRGVGRNSSLRIFSGRKQ